MERCEVIRGRAFLAATLLVVACLRREHATIESSSESAAAPAPAPTYEVHLKTPQPIRAHVPVHLALSIVNSNGTTPTLEETYNASLHVIVVSRDLRWYAHLHSAASSAADVAFDLTFPSDGEYVLFTYFRPQYAEVQTDRRPLVVGNPRRNEPLHPLPPTPLAREIRGYRVEMTETPQPPHANVWETFTLRMQRRGQPVASLGSEGALGHLAIVAEGASDFVFAHSTIEEAGGIRSGLHVPMHPSLPDEAMHALKPVGPEVTFHARFPRPGRYKLWAELKPDSDDVMADFVVDVKQ